MLRKLALFVALLAVADPALAQAFHGGAAAVKSSRPATHTFWLSRDLTALYRRASTIRLR